MIACFRAAPAPSEDHAMLFAYNLILYWQENT